MKPGAPERTRSAEYDANGRWKFAAVAAELKAEALGRQLGAKYGGSADALARGLGIEVRNVDAEELSCDDYRRVVGMSIKGFNLAFVAANTSKTSRDLTLAHEVAHLLNIEQGLDAQDAERVCEAFAKAFLSARPRQEQPASAWIEIQDRLQERAIRSARARKGKK